MNVTLSAHLNEIVDESLAYITISENKMLGVNKRLKNYSFENERVDKVDEKREKRKYREACCNQRRRVSLSISSFHGRLP